MQISPDSIISRQDDVAATQIKGETVILHIDTGFCYGLNGSATAIWDLIEVPISMRDLCAKLVDRFKVDPETCMADTAALLTDLQQGSIIDVR